MKRRYNMIVLLLLVALSVSSVYGVLTFYFEKTYTATVIPITNPWGFELYTNDGITLVTSNPGIQFGVMESMSSGATPYYELKWTNYTVNDSVVLSFTVEDGSEPKTLILGSIIGYISDNGLSGDAGEPWLMGEDYSTSISAERRYLRWELAENSGLIIGDSVQITITVKKAPS